MIYIGIYIKRKIFLYERKLPCHILAYWKFCNIRCFSPQSRITRRKIRMKGHSRWFWKFVQLNILSLTGSQSKWLNGSTDTGEHTTMLGVPSTAMGLRAWQTGVASGSSVTLKELVFPRLVQSPMTPCKLLATQHSAARPSTSQAFESVFWTGLLLVSFDAPCSFTEKDRKSVVPDSLSPCALHDFMEFQISGMLEFYSTENTVEQTSGSQKLREDCN